MTKLGGFGKRLQYRFDVAIALRVCSSFFQKVSSGNTVEGRQSLRIDKSIADQWVVVQGAPHGSPVQ